MTFCYLLYRPMIKHGLKKLVWQSICYTRMNSHARRCTLKLIARRNCFLIYIYYNLSLKNLHKTLFFLSFFLSLSLVTFFFFLSFYCYFYLSDTWVYIDYVICVHVIHVTLEILSSAISGCILLLIIFEYIRLCSAF